MSRWLSSRRAGAVPARPLALTPPRALLLACVAAGSLLWFAGPPGRLALALAALLLAPGYLIERGLGIAVTTTFARPALWIAFSLSAVALLYELATTVGAHLGLPVLAALALGSAAAALALGWRELAYTAARPSRHWVALLGVLALTFWTRFSEIANLALPPWVDSVHHALLIRVAAERGQAPLSLVPYLPVEQLPYHWGYHVFSAAVMQLSAVPLPQTMLWEGQVFNALHALTVAALAACLWRWPAAGVLAAVVVGLLAIMPAYYLSWGRYTQLTGLLLLPAAAILLDAALRRRDTRSWLGLGVILAGLSLIHMRVLIFTGALLLVIVLVRGVRWSRAELAGQVRRAAVGAGAALLLSAPWLLFLANRTLRARAAHTPSLVGGGSYNALNTGLLWAGSNRLLLSLALLAALWGLWRRRPAATLMAGWVGLLVVFGNPWLLTYLLPAVGAALLLIGAQTRRWPLAVLGGALALLNPALVRIPYLSLLTNDVVAISLFVPMGVLLGGGAIAAFERVVRGGWIAGRSRRLLIAHGLGVAAVCAIAGWGAWQLRSVVNPTTVLATRADVAAIDWAASHTEPDARFLINAAPWLSDAERGVDGGWWLLPLAGRWTSTPPVLYVYGEQAYVRDTRRTTRAIAGFKPGDERDLLALIARERIDYVYLGPRHGPLTTNVFEQAGFPRVYQRDGVTIFAVPKP